MSAKERSDRDLAISTAELKDEQESRQRAATEQQHREQRIAECHEAIGRVQGFQMLAKFGDVTNLVWLKDVKESKVYRDLPNVGTWDKFCKYLGLDRHTIDQNLSNLAAFGEAFLVTATKMRVGYRDLRKLRQLTTDGTVTTDSEAIVIGEERIPLNEDHADDLQAAIETIIADKGKLTQRVEKLEKNVSEVVKEETKSLKVERDALVKEVKRLKAFDPEDKDHTWCAGQFNEIHATVATLSTQCGKVILDERSLDDPVVLGQVEGFITGAEALLRDLRRQWESNIDLYED